MIKIKKLSNDDWYIEEIKRLFVHGNTRIENINKIFQKKANIISNQLTSIGIEKTDFSNYKSRTLFEELLVANFADLERIKIKISKIDEGLFWNTVIEDERSNRKYVGIWKDIYEAYNRFSKGNINNEIVTKLGVTVCPYCNENYVNNRGRINTTAQLDHFFPRSDYPIFSICLYNLVPCCYSCNHIKLNKQISVSPHNQSFDFNSMKISYIPESANWINDSEKIHIIFKPINDDGKQIKNNIEMLGISESYKYHSIYVQELLKKQQVYTSLRIIELYRSFPNLFTSEEEVLRIIFGNYIDENDLGRRPLSKLTKDILEELGVILNNTL